MQTKVSAQFELPVKNTLTILIAHLINSKRLIYDSSQPATGRMQLKHKHNIPHAAVSMVKKQLWNDAGGWCDWVKEPVLECRKEFILQCVSQTISCKNKFKNWLTVENHGQVTAASTQTLTFIQPRAVLL